MADIARGDSDTESEDETKCDVWPYRLDAIKHQVQRLETKVAQNEQIKQEANLSETKRDENNGASCSCQTCSALVNNSETQTDKILIAEEQMKEDKETGTQEKCNSETQTCETDTFFSHETEKPDDPKDVRDWDTQTDAHLQEYCEGEVVSGSQEIDYTGTLTDKDSSTVEEQSRKESARQHRKLQNNPTDAAVNKNIDYSDVSVKELSKTSHEFVDNLLEENEKLTTELEASQETIKKLSTDVESLTLQNNMIEQAKQRFPESSSTHEQKAREQENKRLKEDVLNLQSKVNELQSRLSAEIVKGVAKDPNLEAVSAKNRPLALRDRYEGICSSEWLDAKDALDEIFEDINSDIDIERLKSQTLCLVFTESLELCRQVKTAVSQTVQNPLENWRLRQGEDDIKNDEVMLKSLTESVKQPIWEFHVDNADRINFESLSEEVIMVVVKKLDDTENRQVIQDIKTSFETTPALQDFVAATCALSWVMVVQHVPMSFCTQRVGHPLDPETQKPYYSCAGEGVVQYYIQPALYHGEKLLQQGLVFVG